MPLPSPKRHLFLGFILGCLLLLLGGRTASAQEGTWSEPVSFGPYWFPDIAADDTGQVHIVWSNSDAFYDMVMYSNSTYGVEWSDPLDVAAYQPLAGSEATRPTILAGPDGALYLSSRLTDIYVSRSSIWTNGTATGWSRPLAPVGEGYFSRMVLDHTGRLHLFYTQNLPDVVCLLCLRLYATYSDDQGASWNMPIDLSVISNGTAKPQAIVDDQNNLHVVFETGPGGALGRVNEPSAVAYVTSSDRGDTWTMPVTLGPAEDAPPIDAAAAGAPIEVSARNIAIAARGNQLVTVWWSAADDLVYYQTSEDTGITWSKARSIPGIFGIWTLVESRLDSYTMATDSADNVHLVMVGRTGAQDKLVRLMHLVWGGRGWSQQTTIRGYTGDMPEWPRLAIGLGNQLHLTWFVRDQASIFLSEAGKYEVYYARGLADSPPIAPVSLSTPTPEAQVAREEISDPGAAVPTIALTLAPAAKTPPPDTLSVEKLRTENDDVLLLLLSLLPATAVLIGIAIWRRRR